MSRETLEGRFVSPLVSIPYFHPSKEDFKLKLRRRQNLLISTPYKEEFKLKRKYLLRKSHRVSIPCFYPFKEDFKPIAS